LRSAPHDRAREPIVPAANRASSPSVGACEHCPERHGIRASRHGPQRRVVATRPRRARRRAAYRGRAVVAESPGSQWLQRQLRGLAGRPPPASRRG
jgi:hypothetical protein